MQTARQYVVMSEALHTLLIVQYWTPTPKALLKYIIAHS